MKNTTKQIINSWIDDLKDRDEGLNYYLVILKYDSNEFYGLYDSVLELHTKLLNSKSKTMGLTNRDWYEKIKNGFYKSEESNGIITIYMGLIPFGELDIVDLENRIINLTPHPIDIVIGVNNNDMLYGDFSNLMNMITSFRIFGKTKK